jgi:hypothetical protein
MQGAIYSIDDQGIITYPLDSTDILVPVMEKVMTGNLPENIEMKNVNIRLYGSMMTRP